MKLKLQSWYLWDVIEDEDVDFHDDRSALEAICSGVPQEMVPTLATKPSAKEAWEAIRTMRIGDDRVRKSTAQSLRAKYEQISFRDGESVEDFALRLSNLVQRLVILGDPEPEPKVVAKYLRVQATRASGGGRPPSSNQRRGRGHGAPKGQEGGGSSKSSPGGDGKKKLASDECAYCGKTGHWACECRKKKRNDAAHVAQAQEEPMEGALMLGVASLDCTPSITMPPPVSSTPPAADGDLLVQIDGGGSTRWTFADEELTPVALVALATLSTVAPQHLGVAQEIHLHENKLFVQLGEKGDGGCTRWILDTSATNHMMGQRAFFSELDTGVCSTVRFGDGSVVAIEGRGTVLFKCKNGEHRLLSDIYHIPKLTVNIISLGQLDEDDHEVRIKKGILRIWDQRSRLLVMVKRSASRLYFLDIDIA
ncbi:uncharacterized protein [Miscanthus floridulus]|uniref:uncharacterized protein n=1 Tax=Miscanthus floridulus TaxID=154761 RepID=UPI0034599BBC